MKLKATLAVIGLGVLGSAALPANAFMLTNTNGTFTVDEFDFASNGVAWTTGFTGVNGTNFTLNYADYAVAVNNLGSTVIDSSKGLDNSANGIKNNPYEYTIFATLNEQINTCTTTGGSTTCSFNVTGGSFNIYYDTNSNANNTGLAWTGFEDGTNIISGSIASSVGGNFTLVGSTGTGGATLFGTVTSPVNAFVNPQLAATTASTTLQLGAAAGGFVPPLTVDGRVITPGQPVFKGDSNQVFAVAVVPEPASLSLMGLGLGFAGWFTRRRSRK